MNPKSYPNRRVYLETLRRRVYEVQGVTIDHAYVDEWAKRLSVKDLWQRIRREAEPL